MYQYKIDKIRLIIKNNDLRSKIFNSDIQLETETETFLKCSFADTNVKIFANYSLTIFDFSPTNFLKLNINHSNIEQVFYTLSLAFDIDIDYFHNATIGRLDICTDTEHPLIETFYTLNNAPRYKRIEHLKTLYYNTSLAPNRGRKMVFYSKNTQPHTRFEYRLFNTGTKHLPNRGKLIQKHFLSTCEYITNEYLKIKHLNNSKVNWYNAKNIKDLKELAFIDYLQDKTKRKNLERHASRLNKTQKYRAKKIIHEASNIDNSEHKTLTQMIQDTLQNTINIQ